MTLALAAVCALTTALAADGRRRLVLVARAEHELRGALTSLALQPSDLDVQRARAGLADLAAARGGRRASSNPADVCLERVVWSATARADLAARRAGGGVRLDWRAGDATVRADHGRLSQALANLLANAVEHGGANVRVSAKPSRLGVRIVVADDGAQARPVAAGADDLHVGGRSPVAVVVPARGHGLAIAAAAIRDCGGRLTRLRVERGTAFAIDLPLAR